MTRLRMAVGIVAGALAGCARYAPAPLTKTAGLVRVASALQGATRGPVSLRTLDRLVLANNPDLAAARARLGVAQVPRAALREASRNRLRPITTTTLAAVLTLLPLAFAVGQGSAMQQPLAIAIVSGLLLRFPLVLLVMPALIALTVPRDAETI